LKLLCVIDNLGTGGAQRQITNLAIGLHRRGHDVSLYCYTPGALLSRYLEDAGLRVHVELKKSRFSLDVIRGLKRLIDGERFEAVVSFLNTPNFYAILSSRLSKTRPAVVVSERFCDLPGNPNAIERFVRRLYRLSDQVIVNSHHQRENFLRRYPWMAGRIVTIYNGYDLQEFRPLPLEPENGGLRILSVASVSRYKNGLCLVRALDMLRRESGFRPRVSWVGQRMRSGDRGAYLREMEDEIRRSGLSDQWEWLDQRTDMAALFGRHDVLVHPSYGEGLPNVVCEAMACGRPVILSNVLDHPHLVADGVNGYLFDWRNPADLARTLEAFGALSPDERLQMGERGRAFAEEHLTLERYVGEYEQLLTEVVRSKTIRPH
jgi:GalNAc-alpha-(1->4)-GalNAc-alpha-(1->3)-diNAcBac-PP-undecaprenol alpha-1,4-N-acetyl-D-galactosaminyltransferase